ncbi:hypothetical protein HDU76_010289 [Blyttiomyces sp. JEL0837]|nr:hypothetical protein HDU76_010289 [Blyttiomyces sp. JEL0837]
MPKHQLPSAISSPGFLSIGSTLLRAIVKRIFSSRGIVLIALIIIVVNLGLLLLNPEYSPLASNNQKGIELSVGYRVSNSGKHIGSSFWGQRDRKKFVKPAKGSKESSKNPSLGPSTSSFYKRPHFYGYPEFVPPNSFDDFPTKSGSVTFPSEHPPFNTHFGFLRQNLTLMRERTMKMPIDKVRVAFDDSLHKAFFQLYKHLQDPERGPFCPRQPECEFYFTSEFDDGEVAVNTDAIVTDKTKGMLVNNATLHFNKYVVLPDQHQSAYFYDWSGTDVFAGYMTMQPEKQLKSFPRHHPLTSIDEETAQFRSMSFHDQKLPIVTFIIPEAQCHLDPFRPTAPETLNIFLNTLVKEGQTNWSMPVYIIPPRNCTLPSSITLPPIPKSLQNAVRAKCPLDEPTPVLPPNEVDRNLYSILPTDDHIRCALAISRGAVVVEPVPEPRSITQHTWSALAYGTYLAYVGDAGSFINATGDASKGVFAMHWSFCDGDPQKVGRGIAKQLAEVVMGGVHPGSAEEEKQDGWLKSVGYQAPPVMRPFVNVTAEDPLAKKMEWKRGLLVHGEFKKELYNSRVNFPCRLCKQMKVKKTSVRCLLENLDNYQTTDYDVSMNDIIVPGDNFITNTTRVKPSGLGIWSDFLDRIYVVHYSRIPQRLTYMRNLLSDANLEAHIIRDFDRENVPGELHTCLDNWLTTEIDSTREQGGPMKDGEASLILKHYQAFNRMLHQDLSDALILEDDIEWGEFATTEQVADAYKLIPKNYGIVMLGTLPDQRSPGGETRSIEIRLASRSTLAYSISKQGVILNFRNFPVRMPIDLMMIDIDGASHDVGGIRHPDWKAYWIQPAVFNHALEVNKGNLTNIH